MDHTTVYRWVQAYAPELDKRCQYLYRAVDSQGNTLDFMLSAKRDARASVRFFRKAMNAEHNQTPRVINTDKNAVITQGY